MVANPTASGGAGFDPFNAASISISHLSSMPITDRQADTFRDQSETTDFELAGATVLTLFLKAAKTSPHNSLVPFGGASGRPDKAMV